MQKYFSPTRRLAVLFVCFFVVVVVMGVVFSFFGAVPRPSRLPPSVWEGEWGWSDTHFWISRPTNEASTRWNTRRK